VVWVPQPLIQGIGNAGVSLFSQSRYRVQLKNHRYCHGVWHDSSILFIIEAENTISNTLFIDSLRHQCQTNLLILDILKMPNSSSGKKGGVALSWEKRNCYSVGVSFKKNQVVRFRSDGVPVHLLP
jgi:hypothetical protein